MSDRIAFTADQKLKNRLENVSNQTGLTQSEIARRAVLNELKELEEGDN